MNTLENIAISASAGSGKTYALTNRFIYLLHLTEAPTRIISLTFTRTAAGEFFNKIVEKLTDAASEPSKAAALSAELSIKADTERYQHLLQLLIGNMHKLNLQTLDSFFFRIVSTFALELGLSGNLQLLDSSSEPRIRQQIRDSILYNFGKLDDELNEFWHAFKQATFGVEARSIESVITRFIEQLYNLYLDSPDSSKWGQATTIWPAGCPWQTESAPDWDQLANRLIDSLPEGLTKAQINDFNSTANYIRNYPTNEKLNTLLKNAFAIASDILSGKATLKVRKPLELTAPLCSALSDTLKTILWHHLNRSLQNTQGVQRILQAYNQNYDRIVRRPGKLAFSDLTNLLAPNIDSDHLQLVDPETRLLMDYRLDGALDHWLFDEFQDTSRTQWSVVANLIDEILQDASGERSLFYVGDTKQCLYLWRKSDDRLFHEIRQSYANIQDLSLATSWRSAPAIIDAINAVFSDIESIRAYFSDDTAARWQRAWQTHQASPATEQLTGYATWLLANPKEGPSRNQRILETLNSVNPLERGMTVGILVRKNSDVTQVANYLRENSHFPVHTGSAIQPATDNSAGVALLAMLRYAAHPRDTQSKAYLELIDQSTEGTPLVTAAQELRTQLSTQSTENAIRWAIDQIKTHLTPNDTRHPARLDQLLDATRSFDQEDLRDIDALIQHLQNTTNDESATADSIVVETIHKSKGLEYDLVILINEDKTSRTEKNITAKVDQQGETDWIIEPIKQELMLADPQLTTLHQQNESQQGFGSLCTLYVGMTRAKRALYMISDFERVSKKSTVHYLREQLGNEADEQGRIWHTGDAEWFEHWQKPQSKPTAVTLLTNDNQFQPAHPRLTLTAPSKSAESEYPQANLFELGELAYEFGEAIHKAFQKIEWIDPKNLPTFDTSDRVEKTLKNCFANANIQALFQRPETPYLLWREKAFSYIEQDQFISGTFDRVHISLDANGAPTAATIIDFKTERIHQSNTIEAAIKKHRPQLANYRKCLSKILNLPESSITCSLLFTQIPEIYPL